MSAVSLFDSTYFAGFTIQGDQGYGMYAKESILDVNDLLFDCDPDTAILYDYYGTSSVYDSIIIRGPSEAKSGLHAFGSWAHYTKIVVRNLQNRGIYVSNGHGPDFSDITIDSCGTGIYIHDSGPTFYDVDLSNCTTGIEAFTDDYGPMSDLVVNHVDLSDCVTGFSTSTGSNDYVVDVAIDSCTVTGCHDGMILDRPSGHVKRTDFDDIGDHRIGTFCGSDRRR